MSLNVNYSISGNIRSEERMMESSEASFFVESKEVFHLIVSLSLTSNETIEMAGNETTPSGDKALARLRTIFDKYLECPSLLDPHLEKICTALCQKARAIIYDIYDTMRSRSLTTEVDENNSADGTNQFQDLKRYLSGLYAISKVRGRKYVQKYFSHDVFDVEPILHVFRIMEHRTETTNEMMGEAQVWESLYSLLVWLGMLSLVPFDLKTIDSSVSIKGDDTGKEATPTLISSMLTSIRSHLSDAGPTRDPAASSLASLLSRPDLEGNELRDFVSWGNSILEEYLGLKDGSSSVIAKPSSIFLVMGVIQTLANIFKTGSRSNLMDHHLRCITLLWERAILVAEQASSNQKQRVIGGSGGALLLRKLLVKLFARVGCAYLPPRVAQWRYQRGRRSLLENLDYVVPNKDKRIDPEVSSSNNNFVRIENKESHSVCQKNCDLFNVPDEVEDSMAQLIRCLVDPGTTVRWSCAKGIGRVTERLPPVCADDVLDAILELCKEEENDSAWHGACLALAELARRGLLLPQRLAEVVPIVIRAIHFDIPRGQHSVGSNVRDAACYCCWAFARAYAPSILKPYIPQLSNSIVLASLFDREINCRRAASAAFQECVGRQGADNFKHGIDILTAADYFILGNRVESYTSVSNRIAQFKEYTRPIIDHLCDVKLCHWDIEIRKLASLSLRGLVSCDPMYFTNNVLAELIHYCIDDHISVRHGAILGVAEILLGLRSMRYKNIKEDNIIGLLVLDNDAASIAEMVPTIEKARLYRGRGGEIVRSAVSRFIECLSIAKIPLTVKQQVSLLDSLDSNLKHPSEEIQSSAAVALAKLMESSFPVGTNGPSDRLQKRVIDKYIEIITKEDNAAATRGFTLALGYLPAKILAPNSDVLDSVFLCLKNAAHYRTLVGGQGDAETRRNAIQSCIRVCRTVGIGTNSRSKHSEVSFSTVCVDEKQVETVFNVLLDGVYDYNTDRRGDVGSWSRIAALHGLEALTYLTVEASSSIPQHTSFMVENDKSRMKQNLPKVPSFKERLLWLEHDTQNRVQACLENNQPFRPETIKSLKSFNSKFFDEQLCAKVIGAFLKQLSEKLDAVRNQAGICLERLLLCTAPVVPFISCKDILLEALSLDDPIKSSDLSTASVNWANPASTFPLVMRAINIDTFFENIVSGLIISVGGLTESVTKHSSKQFLDYLRALQKLGSTSRIVKLGHVFIRLFDKHTKEGRVILPLLKTLDKLLSHGCLDFLLNEPKIDFPGKILACIKLEASNCTDMKRLFAIVPVAIGMLHSTDKELVHDKILPFLMRFLAHRYPRIRRWTGEQFYVKLIEDGSVVPNFANVEAAINLLSQVTWDQDLGRPGNVRESRNQVAELLGIELSDKDRKGTTTKQKRVAVDEFESYKSLVDSVGR